MHTHDLRRGACALFAGMLLALTAPWARAQCESAKASPSDAVDHAEFGFAVAISGDFAVVGARRDDDRGPNSGSVYVLRFDGSAWVPQQKLLAADGAPYDEFGYSVALSGARLLVGAKREDANGHDSGAGYVFRCDDSVWVPDDKLLPADGAPNDYFGHAVGLDGSYAVIGAYFDDDRGPDSGSAYVFWHDGAGWVEQGKLLASDGAPYDYFGKSVAISGDTIVVGAHGNDDHGERSGSAYVFRLDGSTWSQQQQLVPADGAPYDEFGVDVAVSGNTLVVGAHRDNDHGNDSGSAYVFGRSGDTFIPVQKLLASDGAAGDQFGNSVATLSDALVVGAFWHDHRGVDAGAAYLFRSNGSFWSEQAELLASDGAWPDEFGGAVATSGTTVVVGATGKSVDSLVCGAAYVFDLSRVCCRCDLNCDGIVNAGDIPGFVLALTNPQAWELETGSRCDLLCVGDANDDGLFNAGDIPGFIDCLTSP